MEPAPAAKVHSMAVIWFHVRSLVGERRPVGVVVPRAVQVAAGREGASPHALADALVTEQRPDSVAAAHELVSVVASASVRKRVRCSGRQECVTEQHEEVAAEACGPGVAPGAVAAEDVRVSRAAWAGAVRVAAETHAAGERSWATHPSAGAVHSYRGVSAPHSTPELDRQRWEGHYRSRVQSGNPPVGRC